MERTRSIPLGFLALLWRAGIDPDGAALFTLEDVVVAELMVAQHLGEIERRPPKPHQDNTEHRYFTLTDRGKMRWESVLMLASGAPREVLGRYVPGGFEI